MTGATSAALLFLAAFQAQTGTSEPVANEAGIGQARSVLEEGSVYLRGLEAVSFVAEVTTHHHFKEQPAHRYVETYSIVLKRPRELSLTATLKDEHVRVICDGSSMLVSLASLKQYEVRPQPDDLGGLVGWISQEPALRRLCSEDPAAGWLDHVRSASVSPEERDGRECRRVFLRFDRTDVTVWFGDAGMPVPFRLEADLSRGANHPAGTLTTEITWSEWTMNPACDRERFATGAPDGMARVDDLGASVPAKAGAAYGVEGLLGAPSPPFASKLWGDGRVDLAEYKGKNVVILDFWATWCRPCRQSLRRVAELDKRFKEHGVVSLAVNLMEDSETIAAYVEKYGLELPIMLDEEGELANLLRIEAVPTTVVIGREGTIQSVHVGQDRWVEKDLSDEIERILEGREPVETLASLTPGERLRHRLRFDQNAFCAVFVSY